MFKPLKWIFPIAAPCENLICANNTDTCVRGSCQCGKVLNFLCDESSEFPLCLNGVCGCTKTVGSFEVGDGTTQGSCVSSLLKCHSNGECAECIISSQCYGLSDTCNGRKCGCGTSGACNPTKSNLCTNGNCMCGTNPQCSTTMYVETDTDCTPTHCNYNSFDFNCKTPRATDEACEEVTTFYNPLYVVGKLTDASGYPATSCDDRKGKLTGTFQCLGKVVPTY